VRTKREKIIFLSSKNPSNKTHWSGIPFFMHQSLQQTFDIELVQGPEFKALKLFGYYISRIAKLLTTKKYVFDYGIILSLLYGIYYSRKVCSKKNVRFIFCPAGLQELAFIRTSIPIISAGDCSTLQLIDYYPALTNVLSISQREIGWIEKKALAKIRLQTFSSSWAADFTRNNFGIRNIANIPFGANLRAPDSIETAIEKKKNTPFHLIFIAVDWYRKGGDIVLAVYHSLSSMPIPVHLTIIGCRPPHAIGSPSITVVEHVDKNSKEGTELFQNLLLRSHLMLLPTRADCTPIVISEALSYGVPVLANKTGGVSSMITNGINGFIFEKNETSSYVDKIVELYNAPATYRQLALTSLEVARTQQNWKSWASKTIEAINDVI
jgi:glycosyltransferase involved in cell wall biosynthesis